MTLAVRYGIATPYTSFLVDERAQTEAGRQQIIGVQATAMPKAASGGAAPGMGGGVGAAPVQAAQDQQGLRSADSVVAPSGEYAAQIRAVGTKTFVQRNGVWTDAEYDPSKMTTIKVGFGSDDYFKLLAARPEWGQFFALGERVIVALDGKAYETVQGAGQPVQVPPTASATPSRRASHPSAQHLSRRASQGQRRRRRLSSPAIRLWRRRGANLRRVGCVAAWRRW